MSPDVEWHVVDEAGQQTVVQTASKQPSRWRKIALVAVAVLGVSLGVLYSTIPEPPPPPTPPATPVAVILPPSFADMPLSTVDPTLVNLGLPQRAAVDLVGKIQGQPNRLHAPSGLALDREGNLYVVDGGNQRILKYDRDGKFVLKWGRHGTGDGQFNIPALEDYKSGAIAVDGEGSVYVADTGNARIQKFDSTGKFLLKWSSRRDGAGQLRKPLGVAVDSQGNVYVVEDRPQSIVQKFDRNGKFLREWGTLRSENPLYTASAITIDSQGFVRVTDFGFGILQIFDRDGQIMANWSLSCGDERYIAPLGITSDMHGNVFVTDSVSNRICEFNPNGRFVAQWDIQGAGGSRFSRPYGIAVDTQGNVYVADSTNDRILKFRLPG